MVCRLLIITAFSGQCRPSGTMNRYRPAIRAPTTPGATSLIDVYKRQAINSAFTGGFYADFRGESHMNEDYVTEYKAQTVDGVQTVTFKINPKAAFNDGTPIDVNAVKSYQTIYTAAASGSDYQITPSPIWEPVSYTHLDVYKRQPLRTVLTL